MAQMGADFTMTQPYFREMIDPARDKADRIQPVEAGSSQLINFLVHCSIINPAGISGRPWSRPPGMIRRSNGISKSAFNCSRKIGRLAGLSRLKKNPEQAREITVAMAEPTAP